MASKETKKKDFNKTATTGKKEKKPGRAKKWIFGVIGALVLLIVGAFFFPRYGTINYGICRTFVELQEPYPTAINWVWAWEDTPNNIAYIGYKRIDPFGLESSNEIQCTITNDKDKGPLLTKVDINGKKRKYPQEDPAVLEKFNTGMIGILEHPPSLIMPGNFTGDIQSYR